MRTTAFLMPALALSLAVAATIAPASAEQTPATITVVGQADTKRQPNIAIIDAEIISHAADAHDASSMNDTIQDRVAQALADLHLANAAHTVGYSRVYITPTPNADPQERSGHVVTRRIEIRISPSQIDRVLAALTNAGVETIDDVHTDVVDRDQVYRDLYVDALNDAESQAHTIATASHLKVIRVRSVDASALVQRSPGVLFMAAARSSLPPQDAQISASVTVTYEVEPFPLPGYMRRMPNPPSAKGAP